MLILGIVFIVRGIKGTDQSIEPEELSDTDVLLATAVEELFAA
jgi:hypothetical protein